MRTRMELMKAGFYVFLLANLVTLSLLPMGSGISSPRDNGTNTRMSITSEGTKGNGDTSDLSKSGNYHQGIDSLFTSSFVSIDAYGEIETFL